MGDFKGAQGVLIILAGNELMLCKNRGRERRVATGCGCPESQLHSRNQNQACAASLTAKPRGHALLRRHWLGQAHTCL